MKVDERTPIEDIEQEALEAFIRCISVSYAGVLSLSRVDYSFFQVS